MRPLSVFPFENRPVRKNLQKSSEHRFPETESSVWGQKPPERNNTMKPLKLGLFTLALGASIARASTINLPTPDPNPYPDTESSVNVAVTNWPALGRRVKLTLTANFTPSNCVQIALGQDTDSNGDLAPEETMLCIGVDCGESFIRNEVKVRGEGEQWNVQISSAETEQEPNLDCSPSPSTFTFSICLTPNGFPF